MPAPLPPPPVPLMDWHDDHAGEGEGGCAVVLPENLEAAVESMHHAAVAWGVGGEDESSEDSESSEGGSDGGDDPGAPGPPGPPPPPPHPVPPPPVPGPKPKKAMAPFVPAAHWPQIYLPGFDNGKLVMSPDGREISAHCLGRGHGQCRASMVFSKLPLGYVLSWLTDFNEADGRSHAEFKTVVRGSFDLRRRARRRYETCPDLRAAFEEERKHAPPGAAGVVVEPIDLS